MIEIKPNRIGLTFDQSHIDATQAKDDSDHIAEAFDYLTNTQNDDPLVQAYLLGLRHRFMNDSGSGQQAVALLRHAQSAPPDASYQEQVRRLLAWLSVIEMLPAIPDAQPMDNIRNQVDALNQPPDTATLLDGLWLGALNIGAGIVFNDDDRFAQGEDLYRLAITQHIHPEGYLKGIVEQGDEELTDTYHQQVSGTSALVLMAEMATLAGVDFWSIDNRGVSPITAATYTMYYYYYPEKWKWETELTEETTEAVIKADGAFMEIVHRRSPLRAIEQLFEVQRPMFNIYGGGLTTLTHGAPAPRPKKRWSIFGG